MKTERHKGGCDAAEKGQIHSTKMETWDKTWERGENERHMEVREEEVCLVMRHIYMNRQNEWNCMTDWERIQGKLMQRRKDKDRLLLSYSRAEQKHLVCVCETSYYTRDTKSIPQEEGQKCGEVKGNFILQGKWIQVANLACASIRHFNWKTHPI